MILNELENMERMSASTSSFACTVDGLPMPTVWWTKDGVHIDAKNRIQLLRMVRLLTFFRWKYVQEVVYLS